MNFIQTLQEAADIPLDALKDVIKKDKRVSKILSSKVDITDLDLETFLPTIKYYLLNNRHVLDYVEKRGSVRRISTWEFKNLRKMTAKTIKQSDIEELSTFVRDLFRDLTDYNKTDMTAATAKELHSAMGDPRGYFNVGAFARRELRSLKLQPEKPIVIYRGLYFSERALRDESYGGQVDLKDGLKFLRSVREGTRVVDLNWDLPSAWTTDINIARRYALMAKAHYYQNDPAPPEGTGTTGALGFVISTLIDPKDVVVDYRILAQKLGWESKDEIIVEPGTYKCRIVKKYLPTGEVDPVEKPEASSQIAEIASNVNMLADIFEIPVEMPKYLTYHNVLTAHAGELAHFIDPDTVSKLKKSLGTLLDIAKNYIGNVDKEVLARAAGTEYEKDIMIAHKLSKMLNERRPVYKKYKVHYYSLGDMTADEIFDFFEKDAEASNITNVLKLPRVTDWSPASNIAHIANQITGVHHKELHRKGAEFQKPVIEAAIQRLFDGLGVQKPSDKKEAIAYLEKVIPTAYATVQVFSLLSSVKSILAGNSDD